MMPSITQTTSKKLLETKTRSQIVDLSKIPTEKISAKELKEHRQAIARMKKGHEKNFREIFNE